MTGESEEKNGKKAILQVAPDTSEEGASAVDGGDVAKGESNDSGGDTKEKDDDDGGNLSVGEGDISSLSSLPPTENEVGAAAGRFRRAPSPTWSASSSALTAPRIASSAILVDPYYRAPSNAALVLLSPRFDTPDARELVRSTLLRKLGDGASARITADRSIPAGQINSLKLVDYQYGKAAKIAMEIDPSELRGEVDGAAFEKAFNEKWSDAISSNKVSNALRALTRLGCDPKHLGEIWLEAEDRTPKSGVIRLGPDILCGLLSVGEASLYVLNGFYPAVRGQYISPGAAVHAFVVEWDPTRSVDWGSFRDKICGCSLHVDGSTPGAAGWPRRKHPLSEASGSLRQILWERRAELGIDPQQEKDQDGERAGSDDDYDGWDDVIYVAPSPLEALADRCAWLLGGDPRDGTSSSPSDDAPYGRVLLGRGLPERKLLQWFENPVVIVPPPPPPSYSDGRPVKKQIFDAVRGLDAADCTKLLLDVYDYELLELEKDTGGCNCVVS